MPRIGHKRSGENTDDSHRGKRETIFGLHRIVRLYKHGREGSTSDSAGYHDRFRRAKRHGERSNDSYHGFRGPPSSPVVPSVRFSLIGSKRRTLLSEPDSL